MKDAAEAARDAEFELAFGAGIDGTLETEHLARAARSLAQGLIDAAERIKELELQVRTLRDNVAK